ncbi:MAG: hypothetical protein MR783_01905, partial [Clostridiales bacterium]|nr:hypothetical protein [Clostridiales bacterium]
IPSGRLPRRFAPRNDIVLRTEYKSLFDGNLLQNFRTFFILFRATHFMSLRAKRGNLPEGEPCKTNAVFLSKGNINEKFFSGKKDFVREKY